MHNRKTVFFQGQIETALKKFKADLDLRLKKVFAVLRIQSHLTGAGIRKCEGYLPLELFYVLTNLAFMHLKTVHDLISRPLKSLIQAGKDTFYRFKNSEWSWQSFHGRFLQYLGKRLQWDSTEKENCFILDTSILAKRGKRFENLSFVYDPSQGKTVTGYEILVLGLLTPRNFFPLDVGHHVSKTAPAGAGTTKPLRPRGNLARRLHEATALTKPELAVKMLKRARRQGIAALYLLVDAWFTSAKFFLAVRHLGLEAIGRLKRDRTRFQEDGAWYTLDELYQRHKHRLVKDPALGLSLVQVPVTCGNGLKAGIVLAKGYKEPQLESRPQDRKKAEPSWTAFLSTAQGLAAREVVLKYIGRWSIEVFFKEAKQRLGLGKEQGLSFAAQVFSITLAFCRYSLLAYLLEQEAQPQTIGSMFRQLEAESGALTYLTRLWRYFASLIKNCLDTLGRLCPPGPSFRAYLDIIANTFKEFSPLQGCET